MSTLWTAAEAAAATGGRAVGDWAVGGISIDSRETEPGDLFVALTDQRDGHDFAAAALKAGAGALMVSHQPPGVATDAPMLIVADVLEGLRALARAARSRTRARVVAVTGSAGKTSTKEMLRTVLSRQGHTHAAERSFNNHWGVPLTLARMPADTEFAVIEIGMNAPGEIAPLSRLARPDVVLITTIAPAHLEAFEDLAGIAREKATIVEGLAAPGGIQVVCADVPGEARAALAAGMNPAFPLVWYGTDAAHPCRLSDVRQTPDASVVRAVLPEIGEVIFKLSAPGRHFALNALGVLATVQALDADPVVAAHDLALWQPPEGRGRRETIVMDVVDDHLCIDLFDDAFNANPASMAAALEVLASARPLDGVGRIDPGRRIAILGDMLELGPEETALHAGLAAAPMMEAVDKVHTVGPRMAALHAALDAARRGEHFADARAAAARVHRLIDAGDVILVKGSKGSRVSLIVDAIRKLGHPLAQTARGTE